MYTFFQYNWQVRDEWFTWCEQLTKEELLKERIGGHHNILHTLLHIIDVEYSWVRAMQQRRISRWISAATGKFIRLENYLTNVGMK